MKEQNYPRWDLASLYGATDDPELEKDLQEGVRAVDAFRERYQGGLNAQLKPADLATALAEYEAIQKRALRPYFYAQLRFAGDATDEQNKALMARVREAWSVHSEQLMFFELALLRLEPEHYAELVGADELAGYRHYLGHLREHAPYILSEEAERIIKRKDLTGKEAFVQLFDEVTGGMQFSYTMPGESEARDVSGEELLALLYHPESEVRRDAFSVFLNGYAEQETVLTACFNTLLLDHGRDCELRKYPDVATPTHLDHETDKGMVDRLMEVSENNYGLAQEYFEIKRELLGLDTMWNTDIYAPLAAQARSYTFEEARDLTLEAFDGFSGELGAVARRFFDERRIDVPPAPGKSGGAFCQGMMPGDLPFVLLNFTGTLRDVSTLAHELGHAVHFALSQQQNLFHYQAPLPFAETASVFAEMLLTRRLLDREEDRQTRLALLCTKLEEIIATTFRQNALTRFELEAHQRRAQGLLSAHEYGELWLEQNRRLFGEAVQMIEPYRWGWAYIGHFIHARFYCTSYVFGELLVLSLYRLYREQGEAFVPLYLELLARGGSAPPRELLAPFGIDLDDPGFWQQGYDLVRELLDELKRML